MQIGLISDTHDRLERTQAAVELLAAAGAQVLIHCGDLTEPDIVHVCGRFSSYFVFGNNDGDNVPALRQAISAIDGVCLGWAGEITWPKTLGRHPRSLVSGNADAVGSRAGLLAHGSSHLAGDRVEAGRRWINPVRSTARRVMRWRCSTPKPTGCDFSPSRVDWRVLDQVIEGHIRH